MRFLGGAALVAAVTIVLTGCGSQATPSTSTPTVTVAPVPTSAAAEPTAATVPATPTPSPTATATGASSGNAPANQCTDLGVGIYVADGGGGAGSEYYNVLFTNTGGAPCALRGTPGVSVVTGAGGTQLGEPADRIQTGVKTLTLQAGESVAAPLKVVNIGTDGGPLDGCTVRKGVYRVYPPHSTKAFTVTEPAAVACAPGPVFMTVGPVVRFTD